MQHAGTCSMQQHTACSNIPHAATCITQHHAECINMGHASTWSMQHHAVCSNMQQAICHIASSKQYTACSSMQNAAKKMQKEECSNFSMHQYAAKFRLQQYEAAVCCILMHDVCTCYMPHYATCCCMPPSGRRRSRPPRSTTILQIQFAR